MMSSASVSVWLILLFGFFHLHKLAANVEGDALNALKTNLADPNNVLQSWDPTQAHHCSWFHVTCNSENSVTRVDLTSANLSGRLVSQLGVLSKLQYLELIDNNITGNIPEELGGLSDLVSLDLYLNNLHGTIPATLGNLAKLRFAVLLESWRERTGTGLEECTGSKWNTPASACGQFFLLLCKAVGIHECICPSL